MTDEISDAALEAQLLQRLANKRIWGGKHLPYEHWFSGSDPKLRKRAKERAKALIRQNLVILKVAHYGLQVLLNRRELPRILQILAEFNLR